MSTRASKNLRYYLKEMLLRCDRMNPNKSYKKLTNLERKIFFSISNIFPYKSILLDRNIDTPNFLELFFVCFFFVVKCI